jgi:hypothetical protein
MRRLRSESEKRGFDLAQMVRPEQRIPMKQARMGTLEGARGCLHGSGTQFCRSWPRTSENSSGTRWSRELSNSIIEETRSHDDLNQFLNARLTACYACKPWLIDDKRDAGPDIALAVRQAPVRILVLERSFCTTQSRDIASKLSHGAFSNLLRGVGRWALI